MLEHKDNVIGIFRFDPVKDSIGIGSGTSEWGVVAISRCERPIIDKRTGEETDLCIKFTYKRKNQIVMKMEPIEGVCDVVSTGKLKLGTLCLKYTIMKRYAPVLIADIKRLPRNDIIRIVKDILQGFDNLKKIGYTHTDVTVENIMHDKEADRYVIIDIDSIVRFTPVLHFQHTAHFVKTVTTLSVGWRPERSLFISSDFINYFFTEDDVPEEVYRRCYESCHEYIRETFKNETMLIFLNDHRHGNTPQIMDFKLKIIGTPFDDLDMENLRERAPEGFYIPDNSTRYNLMERLLSKKVLS
jgi:hypothetical protein